jgi:hypothetical protein
MGDYRWVLDWVIGFIDTLFTHTTRDYRQYSPVSILHTLQFTVAQALVFSAFTSRILATDFITVSLSHQITYEVFFSQSNSFLAIILQLPTHFYSSAPKLIFWQAVVSKLDSSLLCYSAWSRLLTVSFYNPSARTTQKMQPLLRRRVYWSVA